jgi:hypothetical protein
VKSSSTINESRGNLNTSGRKFKKDKSLALILAEKCGFTKKDKEKTAERDSFL